MPVDSERKGSLVILASVECNSHCRFCMLGDTRGDIVPLSTAMIRRMLREYRSRCGKVSFSGGEPTLRPDLAALVRYAARLGYLVSIVSNGRTFADKEYGRLLVAAGARNFIISLNAPDGAFFARQNGEKKGFSLSVAGIRNLIGVAPFLMVTTVVSRYNYRRLPDIARLIVRLGVKHVNMVLFRQGKRIKENDVFAIDRRSAPAVLKAIDTALDLLKRGGVLPGLKLVPACALPKHADLMLKYFGTAGPSHPHSGDRFYPRTSSGDELDINAGDRVLFHKAPDCRQCIYDRDCEGIEAGMPFVPRPAIKKSDRGFMGAREFFFSTIDPHKAYLLSLDHRCNYACLICGSTGKGKDSFRSLQGVRAEILKAKKAGHGNIDLGGSEPTLHPELPAIIDFIIRQGMRPAILTNGSMFASTAYARQFKDFAPLAIKLSFHTYSRPVFDRISGRAGSFDRAVKAIKAINEALPVFPGRRDVFLSASVTINSLNAPHLARTVALLSRLGVRIVQFSPVILGGDVYRRPELLIDPETSLAALHKALREARARKMVYYLCNFPVCLVEKELAHIIPKPFDQAPGWFKFSFCGGCPHHSICKGIHKGSLIARYGKELLHAEGLLPKGFLKANFDDKDLVLLRGL